MTVVTLVLATLIVMALRLVIAWVGAQMVLAALKREDSPARTVQFVVGSVFLFGSLIQL